MGHEAADRRDEGVGIIDFDGINAAGVAVDEIVSGERQFAINGLIRSNPIRAAKNPALIKQGRLRAPIKTSHASHRARPIGRAGIGGFAPRIGRRACKAGIEQQDMRGIDVRAVIPDVGDDDPSQRTGKIDPHAARRVIGGVKPHGNRVGRRLACRRVGRFAGGHGHDLLAHDHEAVVENAHHHDEENGQDEREFDESLALAALPPHSQLLEVRERLHCGSSE